MNGLLARVAVAVVLLGAAGCQTSTRAVLALDNPAAADAAATRPLNRTIRVAESGTYALYSSIEPGKPAYQTDLKKGDELGFWASGDRAAGIAGGERVELADFAKGASYTWKIEEKTK